MCSTAPNTSSEVGPCTRCGKPWEKHPISGEMTCFVHGRPGGSAFEQGIWDDSERLERLERLEYLLGKDNPQQ